MGDRALVIFHSGDKSRFSPTVYLHWLGHDVPDLISECKDRMTGRPDDEEYASARFCAIACAKTSGNTGVGLFASPDDILTNPAEYTHHDAGVILVNAVDFSWTAHGGYLSRFDHAKGAMPDEDAA